MAILYHPNAAGAAPGYVTHNPTNITPFLAQWGIPFAQWQASQPLPTEPTQAEVLAAYATALTPYMQTHHYTQADVVHLTLQTPNLAELHQKFCQEHTHSEDEVRFFVQGQGDFWYHPQPGTVFCVRAMAGDLLAVPAGMPHWFDAGPTPQVTVIRLFTEATGWQPNYTGQPTASHYQFAPISGGVTG
jgi:1,2-dihydroxy-3-keto-5-methylthiopentene dioxygenase